jgi:P27 family predicted phage terminase small subunit
MAKRGRKPKNTALKILAGSREDRVNRAAPSPARRVPKPPDHLDEYGLEAWHRLIGQLDELGVVSTADTELMGIYCGVYSRYRHALEEVKAHTLVVVTDSGCQKSNPATSVISQCERTMAALLGEFGLTPASRSRVRGRAEQPRDALAEFLNRKKSS